MKMNKHCYTDERNAQIVIALMKAHGVRDIVVSLGATNDCFVLSVQDDPDFALYSAVDERHRAARKSVTAHQTSAFAAGTGYRHSSCKADRLHRVPYVDVKKVGNLNHNKEDEQTTDSPRFRSDTIEFPDAVSVNCYMKVGLLMAS